MAVFVALWVALSILFPSTADAQFERPTCNSHQNCTYSKVCCRGSFRREYLKRSPAKRCHIRHKNGPRSCYGHYCTSDADCEGLKDGCRLSCQKHRCARLARCSGGRKDCPNAPCRRHIECREDEYCCRRSLTPLYQNAGQCKSKCFGEFCMSDDDCATQGECCKSNECVKCPACTSNADCGCETYCCLAPTDENVYCSRSCVGVRCSSDEHCGPSDECCIDNKCVKCGSQCWSNSDCRNGAYCCRGASLEESKCSSDCQGKPCSNYTDCSEPNRFCNATTCSYSKPCHSNADCVTSGGIQHYCCKDVIGNITKLCWQNCIGYACELDEDCEGPNECCGSDNVCTASCSKGFFDSLNKVLLGCSIFGLITMIGAVVFCWVRSRKKARRRRAGMAHLLRRGDARMHENACSPPNGTQSRTRTPPDAGEQTYFERSPTPVSTELHVLHRGNGNLSVPPPPCYSLHDRFVSTDNEIRHVPPPPYSFNGQHISTEVNDDVPPCYEA